MIMTREISPTEQSLALIKERPFLYDFFVEGTDIIKQRTDKTSYPKFYIIEDIMSGIKTEIQAKAVLEVLKNLGNNDTSSLRNFISQTVNV